MPSSDNRLESILAQKQSQIVKLERRESERYSELQLAKHRDLMFALPTTSHSGMMDHKSKVQWNKLIESRNQDHKEAAKKLRDQRTAKEREDTKKREAQQSMKNAKASKEKAEKEARNVARAQQSTLNGLRNDLAEASHDSVHQPSVAEASRRGDDMVNEDLQNGRQQARAQLNRRFGLATSNARLRSIEEMEPNVRATFSPLDNPGVFISILDLPDPALQAYAKGINALNPGASCHEPILATDVAILKGNQLHAASYQWNAITHSRRRSTTIIEYSTEAQGSSEESSWQMDITPPGLPPIAAVLTAFSLTSTDGSKSRFKYTSRSLEYKADAQVSTSSTGIQLTRAFIDAVAALPLDFTIRHLERYKAFFGQFGTMYRHSGQMGSMACKIVEMKSESEAFANSDMHRHQAGSGVHEFGHGQHHTSDKQTRSQVGLTSQQEATWASYGPEAAQMQAHMNGDNAPPVAVAEQILAVLPLSELSTMEKVWKLFHYDRTTDPVSRYQYHLEDVTHRDLLYVWGDGERCRR